MANLCPRCRCKLDPDTGRHLDDDGQVMSYREDLIHCRASGPINPAVLKITGPAPRTDIVFRGFDYGKATPST